MNVDLTAAIEAATASYGYPLDSRESADLNGAIEAAFPLIVEALRVRAEGEAASAPQGRFMARQFGGRPFPDLTDAGGAARWLARIAQEAR